MTLPAVDFYGGFVGRQWADDDERDYTAANSYGGVDCTMNPLMRLDNQ